MDLPEFLTRKKLIDVLLLEQGWNVSDRSRVILEVDTKQSDFVRKDYRTVADTLKNDLESKYVDYLLMDSFGAPLAIVEAKRTSKDPHVGQKQAEEYADDIKRQTGRDVFIFLSNGDQIIFWDRERYSPRTVKGFYARADLERFRFQISSGQSGGTIEVDTMIVDRPKGIECAKRVVEHFHKGNRKALMVMATGTGKTRVAMAIIKILLNNKRVQRVLFLADRRALRDQAFDKGFKVFFPDESKGKIFSGKYDKSKRLCVSTIQTFQEIYLDKDEHGQFRTPRHIIRMMIELVDPDINDRICDPACGTAGFLVNSYEYIIRKYTSPDKIEQDADGEYHNLIGDRITNPKHWDKLWTDTFYGYDFDNTMVRISLMNMVLHGIKAPRVELKDTLSKGFREADRYTVVLANPPFKGSIDKSDINDALTIKTTKTELLFVERMMHLLQMGGKCGVIVPDGVLFGSSNAHKKLRQILLESCQLEGIVSMPSGVFKPYAGVSTAVLIFTKGGNTDRVWFYDMEADGYSLDDKRTFIDGKGDISDIIQHYRNRKKENPADRKNKCFFVPIREIKENGYGLSISRYKEIEYEEVQYEKPEIIIQKIETLEGEIQKGLNDLKILLKTGK